MKTPNILFILIVIFLISCEFSDSYSCSGYVYDKETNEPIEKATAFIAVDGYVESEYVYTERDGRFFVYSDSVGYIWPFMSRPKEIFVIAFKPGYNKFEVEYAGYVEIYLEKKTD